MSLFAQDGAIRVAQLTDRGEMSFEPLQRIQTLHGRKVVLIALEDPAARAVVVGMLRESPPR